MKTRCGLKYNISVFNKAGADFVTFTPCEIEEIDTLTDEEFRVAWLLKKDGRLKLNSSSEKSASSQQLALNYSTSIINQLKSTKAGNS